MCSIYYKGHGFEIWNWKVIPYNWLIKKKKKMHTIVWHTRHTTITRTVFLADLEWSFVDMVRQIWMDCTKLFLLIRCHSRSAELPNCRISPSPWHVKSRYYVPRIIVKTVHFIAIIILCPQCWCKDGAKCAPTPGPALSRTQQDFR